MAFDQRELDFMRDKNIAEQEHYAKFLREHPRIDVYDDDQSLTIEEHKALDEHMAPFNAEWARKADELYAQLDAERRAS